MKKRNNKYILSILTLLLVTPFISYAGPVQDCIKQNDCSQFNLNVGSSNSFPPINFLSKSGELDGFGKDISDAVLGATKINVKRKHSAIWTDVLQWLDKGEIDLIHDTGYTADRDKYLDYSLPIIQMPEVIFVRENHLDISTFNDLNGKTVACVNNHITHLYLKKFPEINCHIVKRPIEGLTALLSGDVDAFVYPKEIILYFSQKQKLSNKIKIVGEPIRSLSWSMTVKEGNKEVLSLINEGIDRIRKSGQYQDIYNKWFGVRVLSGYSEKELQYIVAASTTISILLVVAILLFFYNSRISHARDKLQDTVDELKATKDKLSVSEARYSEIGQNMPGAIFQLARDINNNYKLNFISKGIKNIIGIDPEVFENDIYKIVDKVPKDYADKIKENINQSATKLTFLQFEFPYSLNNGYLVWFKCASMPMMTSTGDILWNGILLDITELHNLQQQHSMFFDISADMLCIADFNGYFIDISNAWEKTLGFTTEELKAKPFIEFVHPDDRENTINAAEKLSGQPSAVIGFTNRYMCKDGKYRWLDWNAVTVEGNQKIYAVAHDVTELKKATDDLMKMRDDLELRVKERTEELVQARAIAESANNAKSDFLSSMSHELRTPLNAILGFSQLLELQGEENEETSQYAKIIINAGEHLLSLVNDVLDLSKIESGKLVYDIKSINLHNLLEECINLIRPSIKQTTLTLNIDISDCSYFVYTDQMRLKQVLVNLMSNAIKYNREHGDISLSCEQSDGNIKIIVKDTGIGIKQENFYRVFKPFDRIDAEPHIEGTGIGLSLSKKLIEEMKGSIEFESEYGTGSTFAISVPIDPVHISQQNLNSQENILPMNKKNISSKKIIYIEDNLANMQLIEMIIKKQGGIELITAMQPEEGLEKIRSNKPDLLLLDINLPGMDGFALKKIIDKDPDLKEMKIIGLSSYATSLDIQRAEDAGFDGYITKPIKLDNFLETIMKALQ